MGVILAIDIGGSAIKYAIMSPTGNLLSKPSSLPTPPVPKDPGEYDEAYAQYLNQITNLFRTLKMMSSNVEGVAISHAGVAKDGVMVFGGSLAYVTGRKLAKDLSKICDNLPVTVFNDAKCAAAAELRNGALKGVKNGACFTFGTAVGGGVVCNGKVLGGNSGEVSFITDEKGENLFGIFGSATGFIDNVVKELNLPEGTDGKELFDKYLNDKRYGKEIDSALTEYTKGIAVQLLNMHQFYEMEKIAIGGGISRQPLFTQKINQEMQKLVGEGTLMSNMGYPIRLPEVVQCEYGPEANLVGATAYFAKVRRESVKKTQPEMGILR